MSDYRTRAVAQIEINGNAGETLSKLKQRAEDFRDAIARAYKEGNDKLAKKLSRDLKATEKEIRNIQSQTANVEMTLRRLDKASPRELRQTLKALEKDLQKIERGSAAWNSHVAKIKAVKAELSTMNNELRLQESRWERINRTLNNWQTSLMGITALLAGLVMAGRKAVNAFAEMEEEIANTIKYTGMSREDVVAMNESFRKMDTRTGRDKLNELAQEAGRLGKNTREAVQGYVEAADIINVALVDLGEGATQTIAKLTNIFGVEEILGTKDAMLAVGSTVNVLSQNCTAAKPYLVEFAQRMAGVGAQARMTIPEILAFGATLDANGQKVEMSASAISRLIMMLFQKPKELAATVGLDVQKFTQTLTKSTNEGLMMFLGKLQEIGEADALAALSPLFKDLGMDGIRMSQVLATLATHLDMVKWEQEEANKAFKEATSATREYNIFNNTAQAGIDKARKRVNELAISLGEKLLPVYRHIMTSGSAMLRFLNVLVTFIIKHQGAIISLTSAIVAYRVAVIASRSIDSIHYALLVAKDAIMKTHRATVLLCSVAYNKLTGNITRAEAAQKMLNTTMKMNPWGLVLAAVTALGVAIYKIASRTDEFTNSVKENIKAAKEVSGEYVKEQRELEVLFGKLKGAEKGSDDYKSAKKAIIDQYGKYLSGLIDEKGEIINLTDAYDRLTEAIRRSARERGIAAVKEKMEQKYTEQTAEDLNKLQQSLEKYGVSTQLAAKTVQQVASALAANKPIPQDALKVIEGASRNMPWTDRFAGGRKGQVEFSGPAGIVNNMYRHQGEYNKGMSSLEAMENANAPLRKVDAAWLDRAIESLEAVVNSAKKGRALVIVEGTNQAEYKELSPGQAQDLLTKYKNEKAYRGGGSSDKSETSTPPGGSYTPPAADNKSGKNGGSSKAEDKFKAEKEWREREEALNTIAYRTGEKNHEQYMIRQLEIEVEFNRKKLANTKITADETIKVNADLQEALAKQSANYHKMSLADEAAAYNEQVALVQQYYLQNLISREAYEGKLKDLEMEHLWRLDKLQNHAAAQPGADESALNAARQAHDAYQKRLIQDQMENQKAYEDKLKKHQEQLDEVWENYFHSDEEKKKEAFERTRALIEEAYKREIEKAGYTAEEKLEIERKFQLALRKLQEDEEKERSLPSYLTKKSHESMTLGERAKKALVSPLKDLFDDDELAALDQTLDYAYNSFASLYESLGQLWQQEEQLKLAALEQRYDREISMAEGNAYKIKEIERKKAREQAKIKAEGQKRQFAQQVLAAIAQTATAAINAYSSAAAIPYVGHILAPIAASLATAAGMMQVAVIKQQQSLSNAQGYAKGGFTPDGPADKPVGIVHAGEWVASKKLVENPITRPAIDALEFAQRNNRFGSLRSEDVTRNVTAPAVIAEASADGSMERAIVAMSVIIGRYGETMDRLGKRLDEPFVTVNTVSGDLGIKRAQDEYQRLQNNSLPKSKRK